MVHISFWFMVIGWKRTCYKKNTEPLVVTRKKIGLEVNADKTKYMVKCRDQNAGKNHNIKMNNKSFEGVEQFKYFGTAIKYQNSIQEEIKNTVKSENACCHSVQNLLSSKFGIQKCKD